MAAVISIKDSVIRQHLYLYFYLKNLVTNAKFIGLINRTQKGIQIFKQGGGTVQRMKTVYEEYVQTVYGYLLSLTSGNQELAEELTQETFFRATKNIGKFRGECKMSSWLCQIAKYTFYQHIDKEKRHKEVPLEAAVDAAISEEIEQNYIHNETRLAVYKKIQELGSPMKDVIMLRLTGDLSFKEIGDILGKSENWARVTFYRGKQILGRELLKDEN